MVEEQHPGLSRRLPRRRRKRRGNHGQAGGGTSSAVERVDDAGTPAGDMSGVVLAPEITTGVVSPQHASPKWTDDASTLAKDLLGVSLVPEAPVQSVRDATSSPSIDREVLSVFHPVPFRFSFDPPRDPASVSTFIKAYPNLPGYHMWSTWDRLTAVSTYGPDSGWDFFGLGNPSAMRDFMTACDYCLSDCSDDGHSLDDEGCGPSHECFHVDLGGHDEGNHLGMPEDDDPSGPVPRVDILREVVVVPVPAGGQDTQLEQIREMQAKLDEEAGQLVQLRKNIEQEWAGRALAGEARHQVRDVQRRIADDARARLPPTSSGVSQNLAAAAILLRAISEPSTTEGRRIQGELKNLLEDAAVRRAESSTSRRQGCPPEHRTTTSRFMREALVHTGRTRDVTPAAPGRLGNEHHRRDRRDRLDEKVRRGYHPRRGGRYDNEEDRSPSPEPLGLQDFSRAIQRAPFPTWFRALTTITKYSGETRPELWLADYRLAYQLVGTDDDNLIIRNLPLFLSDAARAWLEHLPPAQISNWDDLVKAFARNFQGTYVRPGNSWDLRSCRQQPGESLRDYIRRFSKQRTELPNITDSDVIGAFLAGTTCRDLVSKLGRNTPTKASELMDIATKFASGQEAVEAIFRKDKQPQGRQQEDVPKASAQRDTKKKAKKKSQAKRDAANAELVASAEHRNPRKPPGGANLFNKMLKESCPYHQGPVKHTLEECVMLRRYFHKAGTPAEGGKGQDNDKKEGGKAEEFPEVHGCFMIYGGRVANALARHRKQERREVCSVKVAAPVYLDLSDKPITFDQGDHPNCVPSPGKYPLVVDPVIGNTRLTKVLMDGGSSLNIIYAKTLGLLEIDLSTIWAGAAPFHGIIPGKRVLPLGQLDLPVCFGTPSNFQKETLTFEVVEFRGTYHAVLGRPCYAKFMVVPNYTYLKLKMSGPNEVITVGSMYQHAYECDVECVQYAEALAESEALIADLECLFKEVSDAKRHAGNFEPAEVVKSVPLDPSNDACKQVWIGSKLDPK
jgi:hypothetical protein